MVTASSVGPESRLPLLERLKCGSSAGEKRMASRSLPRALAWARLGPLPIPARPALRAAPWQLGLRPVCHASRQVAAHQPAHKRPLSLSAPAGAHPSDGAGDGASQSLNAGAAASGAQQERDLQEVLELVHEKKAMDVVVLRADDIKRMRVLCDYMVVLTCTSRRHMTIVADHVVDHFRLKGMLLEVEDEHGRLTEAPPSVEDADSAEWMLVDLKHVIVQIFSQEGRDKFQLEAHWRSQSNAALALGQAVPTDPLSSDDPG